MLKFTGYNIVFQEVPEEVTLAINISNCPNRCERCHSPYLREDIGEALDNEAISRLLDKYENAITCVCFMGGDASPREVEQCSKFIRDETKGQIKIAWYSGKDNFSEMCSLHNFDYLKLGAYVEYLGGLRSKTTNQRFFLINNGEMVDMTEKFYKNK